MRKVIAAINMTLDGVCDHTVGVPDEELHIHYSDLLANAGVTLYGRTTYQLMEYWRTILENPTGEKAMDDFATAIDKVPKVVFSHTLKDVDWKTARLATQGLEKEVEALRNESGNDIFVCSPSLIAQLTNLHLIDEYQICIHPVLAGKGLLLFGDVKEKLTLELTKTDTFGSGAIVLYYRVVR